MTESVRHDCEALLSHAGWVRALARHLAADSHAADDLAQDALAAALVRPPPGDRPLRGWLAGIVRNLARQERREAGRRSARERAAARDEADLSSAQLLERLDVHRAVVEAVARLAEPYRDAILMRYFEGLSPGAIAARTSTPLRTVHTRLHRALSRLRAELDRAHGGDRRTWLLALIPFARGSGGWSPWGVGALVMDAKLKIALAAIALVGVCSTIAFWPDGSTDVASASLAAEPSEVALEAKDARAPGREHRGNAARRSVGSKGPGGCGGTLRDRGAAPARLPDPSARHHALARDDGDSFGRVAQRRDPHAQGGSVRPRRRSHHEPLGRSGRRSSGRAGAQRSRRRGRRVRSDPERRREDGRGLASPKSSAH